MKKQVVNDTRLARKMYPNYVDNGDGTVTIEVEVVDNFATAQIKIIQQALDTIYKNAGAFPTEMMVSPKQFERLQKLTVPEGVSIVESVYCPEDKVYLKK